MNLQREAVMWKLMLVPALAFAQEEVPKPAPEVWAEAGLFFLAPDGIDFKVDARRPGSPWRFGGRIVQWTDTCRDFFTGRDLTRTRELRAGVVTSYLFRPERTFSWLAGGALMVWSKRETSLYTGESDQASRLAPFLGGGFAVRPGSRFVFELGLYVSPVGSLHTRTSVSSEDDSGAFDLQVMAGVRF